MFKKNSFHIISLMQKKPINWLFLGCMFFTVLTTLFTFNINEWARNIQSYNLQKFIENTTIILYFSALVILWILYFKNKNKSYENKLRYFLKSNNLYECETIEYETFKNGSIKKEHEKVITSSARLGFFEDDEKIIIRAYKDANNFNEKMIQLDSGLNALLGLDIDNKIDTNTYCDYIFKKNRDKRIIVTSESKSTTIYNDSLYIPLNNNLSWNILKQPHMILAGTTGSGKTTFLNYLIIEFMKVKAELYICDPKRSDLSSLKSFLGSDYVASETNLIAKLCRIVKETMINRFIDYKENAEFFVYGNSYVDYGLKPVFLIFDELGAFRAGAEKKIFTEAMSDLTEIILKGREMGVFVVLSTQQPNANNIPTELRDNLSVRLGMGNMSTEAYRMVFGNSLEELKTINEVGAGYIFLDGLGWQIPKYFEAPYLDYKNFDFIEELRKYI